MKGGCSVNYKYQLFSFVFVFPEPTFYIVEELCFEQTEPILQGESLPGPVGPHHQPAGAMNNQKGSGLNPDEKITTQKWNSEALLMG